ncbi:MAG: sulfatase-like hydrolase/transferase [Verrucomicrobiota bacterium]
MIRKILSIALTVAFAISARAAAPNIIFVLCDDLGYGDTGTFFQNLRAAEKDPAEPWHFTPKIDSLAADGLRIPNHYCPAPVCAPSRASFLTGVHQGQATVRDNQFDKALENNHTIASVLKQAGYATAAIGKWGLQGKLNGNPEPGWEAYPLQRGFDFFHGYVRHGDGHEHYPKEGKYRGAKQVWENQAEISGQLDKCYTTDLFTARAKKWVVDHHAAQPAQPFFLYLAYDTPHAVLELPTMAYPEGSGTGGGLQWTGKPGAMINTATGEIDSYYHPDYAAATYDDDKNPATPEVAWPDVYKRYAISVRRIDDCVGDLRRTLADLGIGKDTLIVFTTDNGPSIESYLKENYRADFFNSFGPFDGIKRDCLEGGIRVGAIANWPAGIAGGRTTDLACQFHDWLPTFCELAGLAPPARGTGTSLAPTLMGSGVQKTPTVYVEYNMGVATPKYNEFGPANGGRIRKQMQMTRIGNYTGFRYSITSHKDPFEIYDIEKDPGQRVNLASSLPDLQQEMKDRVLRLRRPDESAPRPYDEELVPAVTVNSIAGVRWKSHEGDFPWVPESSRLLPTAVGVSTRPDLTSRPRDGDFAMEFSGYLLVPRDGNYTFYLNADTRAVLRLHEMTLIDADFGYPGGIERQATVSLQGGKHPFTLYYSRQRKGDPALALLWKGASLEKQVIPDSAFSCSEKQ